jgi:Flp pilus assembly protein TadG
MHSKTVFRFVRNQLIACEFGVVMRLREDQSGQVLILTALSMTLLLGFLALAVDVGLLFRDKRNLQIAADSAAIAAALDYKYNGSLSSAQTAGTTAASANGVTASAGGSTVAINCPPTSGPNASGGSCNGFFEAIVTAPNQTTFMSMFNQSSVTVAARAVAANDAASTGCIYVLNPTASDAMQLQGSFDVSAPACGVIVDSNSTDALQFTGAGGTLTAGSVAVVGGDGGQSQDSTPTPITGVAPVSDPLNISGPTPSSDCNSANTNTMTSVTSSTTLLTANNITCFSNTVALSNVTLPSGVVVFENGVSTVGTITSGTGGTTLDIWSGALTILTQTILNLTAPTTAPTTSVPSGVALMEPATNSSTITIQKGNAIGTINGIIYAPSAQLYLQDSGGDLSGGLTLNTDLIVNELFDKTATLTINSYSLTDPNSSPLKRVTLVE